MTAIYIISAIAMVIGLMTLYAPNIEKWCDKQLAKKDDKNAHAYLCPVNCPKIVTNFQSLSEAYRLDQLSEIAVTGFMGALRSVFIG